MPKINLTSNLTYNFEYEIDDVIEFICEVEYGNPRNFTYNWTLIGNDTEIEEIILLVENVEDLWSVFYYRVESSVTKLVKCCVSNGIVEADCQESELFVNVQGLKIHQNIY